MSPSNETPNSQLEIPLQAERYDSLIPKSISYLAEELTRSDGPRVAIIYGPTGSGKSTACDFVEDSATESGMSGHRITGDDVLTIIFEGLKSSKKKESIADSQSTMPIVRNSLRTQELLMIEDIGPFLKLKEGSAVLKELIQTIRYRNDNGLRTLIVTENPIAELRNSDNETLVDLYGVLAGALSIKMERPRSGERTSFIELECEKVGLKISENLLKEITDRTDYANFGKLKSILAKIDLLYKSGVVVDRGPEGDNLLLEYLKPDLNIKPEQLSLFMAEDVAGVMGTVSEKVLGAEASNSTKAIFVFYAMRKGMSYQDAIKQAGLPSRTRRTELKEMLKNISTADLNRFIEKLGLDIEMMGLEFREAA